MNTKYDLAAQSKGLVYVKEISVDDLPQEVREEAGGLDQLFAVHDADGAQLALVADRKLAFHLARENDLSPQVLH